MNALVPPADLPTLAAYVAWWSGETPDREAAILDGERITYARLAGRIDALAAAMLAAGVARGDRVATLATPSPDFLVAYLAASSIGAIWIGLNPKYRLGELLHVCTDATPRLLLTRTEVDGRRYDEEIAAVRAACPGLLEVVALDGGPVPVGAVPLDGFLRRGAAVAAEALAHARAAVAPAD